MALLKEEQDKKAGKGKEASPQAGTTPDSEESSAEDDDWEESDEEQKYWIGCDGTCGKWCHYQCAGYKRKPSKTLFFCSACKK